MDRLKILEKISNHSKRSLNFWITGILIVLTGVIIYFISPIVIKSIFNVSDIQDFNSSLQNKQLSSAILTYLSYALMIVGSIVSLVIGEIYAGYAVFESVKLKNYDKNNIYYDYSILSILSCFLLPFIFQAYFRNQVKKEINYFKRNETKNEEILDLMSEEEWNKTDVTGKTKYLNYLIKNGVIDEEEYNFLLEEIENSKINDKHKDYISSDDMDYDAYNDREEITNPNNQEKKNQKVEYYELDDDLSNVISKYNSKNSKSFDEDLVSSKDDEEIIKQIKEETSSLTNNR